MALICLSVIALPIWLKLLLLVAIIVSWWWSWQLYAGLMSKFSAIRLLVTSDDKWQIITKAGELLNVELMAGSFISRYLVLLNFKRYRPVVLFSDSTDHDSWRRLRVYLLTNKNHYG